MSYIGNYLTVKEVDILIDTMPKISKLHTTRAAIPVNVLQLLLKIIYHGMLRVEEAVNLRKSDIDFKNDDIILRETQTGWTKCECHGSDKNCLKCGGKGKHQVPEIALFSSPSLWQEIREYVRDLKPDQNLFESKHTNEPLNRQNVWDYLKTAAEIAKLKKNVDVKSLRDSRAHHLRITGLLRESEINQLYRGDKSLISGAYVPTPSDVLKRKELQANEFLLTFCEDCDYKNPEDAIFCCRCGHPVTQNKKIIQK